jgi:hypothetical protein
MKKVLVISPGLTQHNHRPQWLRNQARVSQRAEPKSQINIVPDEVEIGVAGNHVEG